MAKRYSGNLQINVVYNDKNHYRTAVSRGGKLLWRGVVNPAPAGFGPGVAYDSPKAYDEVASSALAFADDEKRGIADEAEFDEDLTGYLIRRAPRSGKKSSSSRAHATKKTGTWERVATVSSDWTADANEAASDLADAIERKFGVERMIEGSWPNYRVLAKGDEQTLEKARGYAVQWLVDYGERAAKKIKAGRTTAHTTKKITRTKIVARKIGSRWQPVDSNGRVVRGGIYNADGTGYSTKEGAVDAAAMLRKLGTQG